MGATWNSACATNGLKPTIPCPHIINLHYRKKNTFAAIAPFVPTTTEFNEMEISRKDHGNFWPTYSDISKARMWSMLLFIIFVTKILLWSYLPLWQAGKMQERTEAVSTQCKQSRDHIRDGYHPLFKVLGKKEIWSLIRILIDQIRFTHLERRHSDSVEAGFSWRDWKHPSHLRRNTAFFEKFSFRGGKSWFCTPPPYRSPEGGQTSTMLCFKIALRMT